jgi:hypothetical protein
MPVIIARFTNFPRFANSLSDFDGPDLVLFVPTRTTLGRDALLVIFKVGPSVETVRRGFTRCAWNAWK